MQSRKPTTPPPRSFYWYDLETSGTHAASDRIMQFAGRRTDAALNPIDEPYTTFVRLAADVLPHPEACVVTGITPQRANAEGVDEWEALSEVDRRMREPGTCVVGYNNLRFDDDFLRFGLYRNLMDPYAREWQEGNSRWDLIDLARAACALRPDGIQWPREDGVVTFRLERLCAANGIRQDSPHDALWDVEATIGLARLLKAAQPRLWTYALDQRIRGNVAALLLPLGRRLCVHVSRRFSNERFCAAPVVSVAVHPEIRNRVVVADLSRDIDMLLDCDSEELKRRVFGDLADDEERAPVKEVVLNRCPFVAPIEVVRADDAERLGFDLETIERRRQALASVPDLATRIGNAYRREPSTSRLDDAEFALYDHFIDDADKAALNSLQTALATDAPWPAFHSDDERLVTLALRLKARLRPTELDVHEAVTWQDHVRACLEAGFGRRPSLADFREEVAALGQNPEASAIVRQLAAYEPLT
ncbi:MAG: exodeoxyribonuclease I [Gammaproteobacteria bacterium]|nr:exodeoxyribonuclease I [Gammaproteobacteria bacterium]